MGAKVVLAAAADLVDSVAVAVEGAVQEAGFKMEVKV